MFNFISDLDKTLVYSHQIGHKCVEFDDERQITYMTKIAYNLFINLLNNSDFNFIPCTLRDYKQTTRISFIDTYKPKYIICDNGASIYVDGQRYTKWDEILKNKNIINKELVGKNIEIVKEYIEKNNIPLYQLKSNDDMFFVVIFDNETTAHTWHQQIRELVDEQLFDEIQGRKLYFIPKGLDKKIACEFLIDEFQLDQIITAGDSSVDINFTSVGDYILLPKHAVFIKPNSIRTKSSGIEAGEEIVKNIVKIICKAT